MFPSSNFPSQGQFLLLTDEPSSAADFLLHKSLNSHLKGSSKSRCIVLSVSESLARWKAVSARSNTNLDSYINSESLEFVDVCAASDPPNLKAPSSAPFRPVLDELRSKLGSNGAEYPLVILDDISSLEWIGFSVLDLTRFLRALLALIFKFDASLIVRHHIITPGDPDDLLRFLLELCTFHMEVRTLSSGRSGAVSGEIALHPGRTTVPTGFRTVARARAVQYRLTDAGSVFFEKGTGEAVL
ncbi:hypothetical protein JAAARDRAFT_691454 [Jaapia argillacea MUCL 33604]|uniref:Elongator complex protein 5 n=1 Tax=Jaapia argillacea MUCL 33604 TaxID=933084 RepID=A0A067PWH0_9AGAM|nr:hypothetical protein JAAARDRAFT_691454 [Jaapia argillacea MUCL 33604]